MRDRNLLALLLFSLLAAPVLVIQARRKSGVLPEHQSLNLLPTQIGKWAGDDVPLDRVSREELKLGDYVFREYQNDTDAPPITLFIEYEPMEPSAMIHMEEDMCLAVRGSIVKDRRHISLCGRDGRKFTANQSVVSRAGDRMLVEYWYQIHGRTVASQSWARYYLMCDRIRLNRSDAALLMLTTHLKNGESVDTAQERLRGFEFSLMSLLDRYIPR